MKIENSKKLEEELEKQKKETLQILQKLGLEKMFQDEKRLNEVNRLMNLDLEKQKEKIIETVEKTEKIAKNYNSVFNYMDNGKFDDNFSFKPIIMKLFDNNEDNKNSSKQEQNEDKNDNVFAILKASFGDKFPFDEKGNPLEKDSKEVKEVKKEVAEPENIFASKEEKEKSKKQNKNLYRDR